MLLAGGTLRSGDRDRLDQYFTSVRDLEHRLRASRGWEDKPKPVVSAPMPIDPANPAAYMDKVRIMYDLARLAFETDSTRAITLMLDGVSTLLRGIVAAIAGAAMLVAFLLRKLVVGIGLSPDRPRSPSSGSARPGYRGRSGESRKPPSD